MPLLLTTPYGNALSDAFRFARERGILPTWMGSEELRDLEASLKERAVFSARTTNAVYLEELKERIQRFLADGYNGDQAKLRLELKGVLKELAYDPETGFPGDAELGIPAARAGSLQDLNSDRRINLILETQLDLMAGKGQQQRGLEAAALDLFPAYELVRLRKARLPRDWQQRWQDAGGVLINDNGRLRMVALKTSEIWSVLGDPAIFPDALGVSYPPFAFRSGMGWEPIERDEWDRLLKIIDVEAVQIGADPVIQEEVRKLPPATVSSAGLSIETLTRLRETLRNAEAKGGKLTLKSVFNAEGDDGTTAGKSARITYEGVDLHLLACVADLSIEINSRHKKKKDGAGSSALKQPGKPCGDTFIPAWKECHQGRVVEMSKEKAVALLSSDKSMTAEQAAAALKAAPHHHLHTTARHWFDKSFRRLNQNPGSKETKQLSSFIQRIEPTPLEVPLYRGMRFRTREEMAAFVTKAKAGQWPDMPINAFSKRPAVAHRFAQSHSSDAGEYNAIIKLSRSKSGRDLRPLAETVHPAVAHQEEVVFLPEAKFNLDIQIQTTPNGLTAIIQGHED